MIDNNDEEVVRFRGSNLFWKTENVIILPDISLYYVSTELMKKIDKNIFSIYRRYKSVSYNTVFLKKVCYMTHFYKMLDD